MDNKNLKQLLRIMRSNGVLLYKTPELELQLSADHLMKDEKQDSAVPDSTTDDKWANFPDGDLTPEQLTYYSAGGSPEEDPENNKVN